MHIYLAARHLELTPAIRDYAEEHLLTPIREHTGLHLTRIEVQLFPEGDKGNHFGCHVRVEVKGDRTINVRELAQTVYAAIDLAKDRVLHSLTDLRDRLLTVRRRPKKYSFARLARALGWTSRAASS